MNTFFAEIGTYSPLILIALSIHLLWHKENLLFYYTVGVFVNAIINLILKGIIQQPRPCDDCSSFHLALTHGKRILFKNGIPFDIFGMPSGHAQSVLFSTIFMYMALRKRNILYVYLAFSLLTIVQRVSYNYHTYMQILVGCIVGAIFGYIVYKLAREKIKGPITEKVDDFGPI